MLGRRLIARASGMLASALAAAAAGCLADTSERPSVVAGFYPYGFAAEQVGGDAVSLTNLTSPGVEPHDVELSPQQVAAVALADLVIYQRGFQPALDEAVDQADPAHLLDVAQVAHSRDPGGAPAAADPHLWLDPSQLAAVANAVADELSVLEPGRADRFRANARALARKLERLDTAYRRGLADCDRDVFVTAHAAFGHLARRYGLRMVAIAGLDPHAEPSPARQAEIVDLIRRHGVTTVFAEPLGDQSLAESVADETATGIGTLDPIEGLAGTDEGGDYLSIMRANLAALRAANGCR